MLHFDVNMNAVGIDFGTTECCAAVIRKNGPDFVVLGLTTNRTMPSYVSFDEKEPKCGQIVLDRMGHKCEYSVFDIKRIIGRSIEQISIDPFWPFNLIKNKENEENVLIEVETFNGKENKSPEEISAVLLSRMKMVIEEYQNKKLPNASIVITIPAKFSERQKNSIKIAAELSGWSNIRLLPEPVAATFTYFSEIDISNNSNILICDFGGGTVDICVAKIINDELHILNVDSYLGGRDFDTVLFTHFNATLKQKFGVDVAENRKKYVLNKKCQKIKHTLSAADVYEYW
uniref:Heat shock protein 70 n=1 Tax=Panagrolaimus sp. ES5 TaxID=591445 RepID=A0AC34FA19_9BILA